MSDWTRRYGTPMTAWRPPASQARQDELAIACARDGYALLEAVYDNAYMACALNLLRLHAYWTGTPLDRRRTSHLARPELSLIA